MERYPAYSGTLGVNYEQPINDDWLGNFRVDYIYTGRQFETAANIAWTSAAHRFNARLGVSNETYTFELFGKNIFDDKTPSNILRNGNPNANPAQGLNLVILAPPENQMFGVRARLKY
jgi:iron complex outermembrane receptor protein